MKIYRELTELNMNTVVALGNFDSMHIGHKRIIKECSEYSRMNQLTSVVLCFNELPMNVIAGKTVVKNVLSFEDKAKEIEKLRADYLMSIDFCEAVRSLEPADFVREILIDKLHVKSVFCGFNYSFGFMGRGTADDLCKLGKMYGFNTTVIPECTVNGNTVSSTDVRLFLSKANLKSYSEYTGRNYSISGIVAHGENRGNKMGFPTLNIYPSSNMQLPKSGVYFTRIELDDSRVFDAVTYVGSKPTFENDNSVIESFVFDFNEDLYGKNIRVSFIEFLRDEYKFDGIESLKNQIEKDCEIALHRR